MGDDDDARLPMVDDMGPSDPDYTLDDPWGYAGKAGIGDGVSLNSILKEVGSMDEWMIDGGGTAGLGCRVRCILIQISNCKCIVLVSLQPCAAPIMHAGLPSEHSLWRALHLLASLHEAHVSAPARACCR